MRIAQHHVADGGMEHDGRRPIMTMTRKALGALALGLTLATAASPSFAQRADNGHMNAAREKAVHDCSVQAGKYTQGTFGSTQIHAYRTCMMEHGQQNE
jgi:hypothetical protein